MENQRHWMFLTHPDNWEKCLQHSLFGFDQEYAYTVEHFVKPGDQAMIYLAKQSAIWGVVEITEVVLNQTEPIGWLKKGWEARKGGRIEAAVLEDHERHRHCVVGRDRHRRGF